MEALKYRRVVVKLGTSVLTGGTKRLDRAHMIELVRQCVALHREGRDVIIVSSGAIAAGREKLNYPNLTETMPVRQMLAAVGQSRLMLRWEDLFEIYGIHVGQLLLTRADIQHRERFLNARDTLSELLKHRIIPIINENDAVATAEIKVGDNDNLSALVALVAGADLLMLLTDQAGLYTADPRSNPDAQLIPEVHTIDEALRKLAGGSVSGLGIGGMSTKLQAADIARRAGADVVIAAGRAPDVITRIAHGYAVGTRFPAMHDAHEQRKGWIFAAPAPIGSLVVDETTARSLAETSDSLLPESILNVEGSFARGDAVFILDGTRRELARGIVRYGSDDLSAIKGCQAEHIQRQLGYANGPAVHRDDMILV